MLTGKNNAPFLNGRLYAANCCLRTYLNEWMAVDAGAYSSRYPYRPNSPLMTSNPNTMFGRPLCGGTGIIFLGQPQDRSD